MLFISDLAAHLACHTPQECIPVIVGIPSEPDRPYITDATCLTATVSWRPPVSDGGRDIEQYWVRYKPEDATQWSYIL